MAISVVSNIARWAGTPANGVASTSGSFTPADGSLLILCITADTYQDLTGVVFTAAGGSLTWTSRIKRNGADSGATAGHCEIFTAPVTTGASMTVSVTRSSGNGGTNRVSSKVYVVTGQHASPIGLTGEGSSTTNAISPTLFTATANGRAFYCATDWNALGLPSSTDTEDAAHYAGEISIMSAYRASDHAAGAVTGNMDAYGTAAADWNWVSFEVLAGAGGPAATSLPPHVAASPARTHFLMR